MAERGFYVVAFTDRAVRAQRIGGRPYECLGRSPVFAVGTARSSRPPLEDDELVRQHEAVVAVWRQVDAILPVRFGALSTRPEVQALMRRASKELAAALDQVRGMVQMNVRFIGERQTVGIEPAPVESGRDYLDRRRAAARVILNDSAEAFVAALERIAVAGRRQTGGGNLLATIYHLVPLKDVETYRAAASSAAGVGAQITGPFPPFAFTPSLL